MKSKTILALVAGLIGAALNAEAAIITVPLDRTLTKSSIFDIAINGSSIVKDTFTGLWVGGYNTTNYQQGFYFGSNYPGYNVGSSLVSLGSTIDATASFVNPSSGYKDGNPFTGSIYEPFSYYDGGYGEGGNTYYGFLQGTGTGGTSWTLDSITWNTSPGASMTVFDTTASTTASTSAVPEPSSQLALIALGSAGVLTRRRLKRKA